MSGIMDEETTKYCDLAVLAIPQVWTNLYWRFVMTHSITTPSFCVYKIHNLINNKLYIGVTSRTLQIRWKQHIRESRDSQLVLYRAMKKYGADKFIIELIETCPDHQTMLTRERYWIQQLDTMVPNGYNNTAGGEGIYGMQHSEETKRKISNKPITPEFRNRMREIAIERAADPEYIAKLSKANTGKHLTEVAKEKIREARSKQIFTPEIIEKRMQKIRGMKHTDQSRANMSKAQEGRTFSPEHRSKIRKTLQKLTDEQAAIIKFDVYHLQQKEYALMFSVSPQCVCDIAKGRRYTYITREHLSKTEGDAL